MDTMLRVFALFIVLSSLSACTTVTTDNPIGMSGGTQIDTRLIGGWKVVGMDPLNFVGKDPLNREDSAYVFISPRQGGGLHALAVSLVAASPTDDNWKTFEILTGKTGSYSLVNVRPLLHNGELVKDNERPQNSGYWPLLYHFESDGSVQLFSWEDAAVISDAIQSGQIAGTAGRITADPQSLDLFFAEAAQRAFPTHVVTLQPIDSTARSFVSTPPTPAFDAYGGSPKPDANVGLVRVGEAVSIIAVEDTDGHRIYDPMRDALTNQIRLLPGSYRITAQMTYNRCNGCQETVMYTFDVKAGHTYVWEKSEARYHRWALDKYNENGEHVGVTLF